MAANAARAGASAAAAGTFCARNEHTRAARPPSPFPPLSLCGMPPKRKAPGAAPPAPPPAPALPAAAVAASVSCAVCTETYEVPVAAPGCGHTFCRACVQDCCAVNDTSAALCPLCRAPLVAQPWPARREPYTSRQATAIAGWHESVAVRGVCDVVRGALPPPSSSAAASAALRYLRGAGYAVDEGRVQGLLSRIHDADWATADALGRSVLWWKIHTVVGDWIPSHFSRMFVKDKCGVSPIALAFTAHNTITNQVWDPSWFVEKLHDKIPCLKTLPLQKLKEAGVVDIFLRVLRLGENTLWESQLGDRYARLLEAAPALAKLEEFKAAKDEIARCMGAHLVQKANDAASKIA